MPKKQTKKKEIAVKRNSSLGLWILIIAGLIIILLLIMYFFKGTLPKTDPEKDSLAKCLTEKGAIMYGAYWCSHCKEEKELFGTSFQFVTYVECTEQGQVCDSAGVTGYPTWKINGKSYPGFKTIKQLKELSRC